MTPYITMDERVRTRLQTWPQRPPGLLPNPREHRWFRGRPDKRDDYDQPFLKSPGSGTMKTLPDGLWLGMGGSPSDCFADLMVIEACGTTANLFDKRSRFAPSTQSLMLVCPLSWLCSPRTPDGAPRWQFTGLLTASPERSLVLPVRDLRVFYAVKQKLYDVFLTSQVPHAHEFFMPVEALIAEHSDENPEIQALFARASSGSNFFRMH